MTNYDYLISKTKQQMLEASWGVRDYIKMDHPEEYKEVPGSRQYMTAHDQEIWDKLEWKRHLQAMVISEDPITYIYNAVFGSKEKE